MGKFEKQNRPGAQQPPQPPRAQGAYQAPKAKKKKSHRKRKSILLPIILAVLVVAVGIAAGLLFSKLFGEKEPPVVEPDLIRKDTYIAGVNIGGLEKQAALELLMESFPPIAPPATTPDGVQEPIYSHLYMDRNMNIRLYTTPAQILLFTSDYDPSGEIEVDIYGKPLIADPTVTEGNEETQAPTDEEAESTEATSESTETPPQESTDFDPDAPVDENGAPYILDRTICLPASQVNITLNLTAAVDRAFAIGRETDTEPAEGRLDLDLRDFMTLDESYIREVLERAYEETLLEGADTVVEQGKTTVKNDKGEDVEVDCLIITFGTMSRSLDAEALYTQVMEGYYAADFDQQAVYKETLPRVVDLDELYTVHGCTMPVNAVCDPKTFEISEEKAGYGFLMKDALALAQAAAPGEQIILPMTELAPKYTKAEMQKLLFSDVLGKCKSPHVYNPARTKNLDLAAKAINGMVLLPGEVFSFNRVVGERTAAKGYQEAGVYVGGRTEAQLGGGVCQVASAIYYSCLKADLEIVERYEHRYVPDYVPWGMDATIYWGSLDYKFRNNTPFPIRINVSVHDGAVFVELVGTETKDYTVKLDYSSESKEEDKSEVVKIYIHPDMKDYAKFSKYKNGDTIQVGYNGCVVKTYMYKYDKDGNLISTTRVNTSKYARRDKEVAYLLDPNKPMQEQIDALTNPNQPTEPKPTEPTEPTTPTDPPETDPPETDPPETDPPETDPPETDPPETDPPETEPPTDPSDSEGENGG